MARLVGAAVMGLLEMLGSAALGSGYGTDVGQQRQARLPEFPDTWFAQVPLGLDLPTDGLTGRRVTSRELWEQGRQRQELQARALWERETWRANRPGRLIPEQAGWVHPRHRRDPGEDCRGCGAPWEAAGCSYCGRER